MTGQCEDFLCFIVEFEMIAVIYINDLFINHLRDTPECQCQTDIEDAEHYFFNCLFLASRYTHFDKTRAFHPLSVHAVLNGNRNLSEDDNQLLFDAVNQYIYETKRFN